MPDAPPDRTLHLPSLVIKNFRGIDELTIPRLGRVTLLAGKNGVGKTTVLEAVKVFAGRSRTRVMSEVLIGRDEWVDALDPIGEEVGTPDWESLFPGRRIALNNTISIGTEEPAEALQISVVRLSASEVNQLIDFQSNIFADEQLLGLQVTFRDFQYTIPASYAQDPRNPRLRHVIRLAHGRTPESPRIPDDVLCNVFGPLIPYNEIIEQYLDDVALTEHEQNAIDALNLIANDTVERVAAVGSAMPTGRRILVKVRNDDNPVPLRSLGDGAVRTFAVALALANSGGGLLLIDEAENGIHHSIQPKFWNMILQTAQRNNVQVIATTHSWDCVKGFAQAANELEDVEGLLVRLERVPAGLKAITYDESRLAIAASSDIEVR